MKKAFLVPLICIALLSANFVMAQAPKPTGSNPPVITGSNPPPITGSNPGSTSLINPFAGGETTLFGLLKKIINEILLPIGGILAVLAFIYSGFLYVMARGKPADISKAHLALLYTAIGTALLLGAWVFANVICQTVHLLGGPVCPA